MSAFFSALLHLDKSLATWIQTYGVWIYLLLFLVIFCETGLVVLPFLPGDSLLFVVGIFAAKKSLSLFWVLLLLGTAAVLGNTLNYILGRYAGQKFQKSKWLNPKYLQRANQFYEKYGNKAVVLSRFLPILRTLVPFVAGLGQMPYRKFTLYNILGGASWVCGLVLLGYLFGDNQYVQKHFSWVIVGIVVVSLIPALFSLLKRLWSRTKEKKSL